MDEYLNILLLEDSAEDAELINNELSKPDFLFSLKVVATEGDFLNALKSFSPDLILADYTLPSYDGLSALLSTREKYPYVPFIFVSGTIGEEKAIEAMRSGATDYVLKEKFSKLVPAVIRAIRERDERQKRLIAEESLMNSARDWRATFDAIDDVICLLGAEGKILRCNKAMARFLDKPFTEIIGGTCWELLHRTKEPVIGCPVSRMRETRKRETMQMSADDKILKVTADPVLDKNGNISQAVHIISDITDMERSKQELQASEERYRALFDYNPVQTIIVDKEAKIAMCNFVKKEGRSPKIGDVMYKDYAEKHQLNMFEELIECIRSGNQKEFAELQYNERFLHIRISPFSDGAIITSIDLTEMKTLHERLQQSQKMEAVGTLAGGIAHDFNNILAIIIGNTELALDNVPEWNAAKEYLKEIQSASSRAKELVRHILSFSHKTVTDRKPIRIGPIIDDTLKMLRASISTNIEVRQNISCESDMILADSTQVSQVLMNLCTNAAYAMRDESGILDVSLHNFDLKTQNAKLELEPGRYVKLVVSDTGHGIDPKNIDRIFDPYFTTKGLREGTGLGLSVVQGIVKTNNGAITVKSDHGKGTVFEVLFPVIEGEIEPEAEEIASLPTGTEKILFIDDEESIAKLVKKRLEMQGYKVETKNNPVDALELVRSEPYGFDLVITDMTMPKITGDILAKEILSFRPDMPIILCSGYSDRIDHEKAAGLGICKYIEKPLNMPDFTVAVRKALDDAKG